MRGGSDEAGEPANLCVEIERYIDGDSMTSYTAEQFQVVFYDDDKTTEMGKSDVLTGHTGTVTVPENSKYFVVNFKMHYSDIDGSANYDYSSVMTKVPGVYSKAKISYPYSNATPTVTPVE